MGMAGAELFTLSRWRCFLLSEELKICSRNEPQLASSVCWRRALFHHRGRNLIREREQWRKVVFFCCFFFYLYELRPRGVVILAWRSDSLYHRFLMERICQSNSHLFLLVYVWNVKWGKKKKVVCVVSLFGFPARVRFPLRLGIPDSSIQTLELTCGNSPCTQLWIIGQLPSRLSPFSLCHYSEHR